MIGKEIENETEYYVKFPSPFIRTRLFNYAVYHFNLFSYLKELLKERGAKVFPEFPTGNGKIDLIIDFHNNRYGIELKSFSNELKKKCLRRAAGILLT